MRTGADLPGAELIAAGLADLEHGAETDESLLMSMAASRLCALGLHFSRRLVVRLPFRSTSSSSDALDVIFPP